MKQSVLFFLILTCRLPSGVPRIGVRPKLRSNLLIVHNVEGAKMEDVLFQYEVTGHHRYLPEALGRARRGVR
jgi:uncharacterized protein YijF (DUF1287 family)